MSTLVILSRLSAVLESVSCFSSSMLSLHHHLDVFLVWSTVRYIQCLLEARPRPVQCNVLPFFPLSEVPANICWIILCMDTLSRLALNKKLNRFQNVEVNCYQHCAQNKYSICHWEHLSYTKHVLVYGTLADSRDISNLNCSNVTASAWQNSHALTWTFRFLLMLPSVCHSFCLDTLTVYCKKSVFLGTAYLQITYGVSQFNSDCHSQRLDTFMRM